MYAWHFVGDKLRDGRPVPDDGVKLIHKGELIPRKSGLHASKRIIDALKYAPGNTICRVKLGGEIVHHGGDKVVATERTIIWRIDGDELLHRFARKCALDVVHLWDASDCVAEYLKTGNEALRYAARGAAWGAAWNAARGAARGAARCAARGAAWGAAWDAARGAQNRRLTSMVMAEHKRRKI